MSEAASIEIASSRAALARNVADLIAAELRTAVTRNGKASFVATGGASPVECYKALRDEALDWAKVSITLSDERWVDVVSPQSNERLLRETLLVGPAAAATFVPLKGRRGGVNDGARRAEAAVRALAPFDVSLLGMGEDGHIASLFPGHPALGEGLDEGSSRFCIGVAAHAPAPDLPRVSLTLAALMQSRLIVLMLAGEEKWRKINDPGDAPIAALLRQTRAPVRIFWAA
jgi:6-phosphogluconolactonase